MAIGILMASGQIPATNLDRYEFAGELSLSGELRPIRGALAMTFAMHKDGAACAFILPAVKAAEASLVRDALIYPARSLIEVAAHFSARDDSARLVRHVTDVPAGQVLRLDLVEVKGQARAKRALEIAAAGGHSLLMIGPPGSGKSMLAARLPGILPPMTDEEALESAAVQSLTSGFQVERWRLRPYRAPHHTASAVALVGGGSPPRPGEISLAHRGLLFLDELPEFDRRVLEVLREPLESGRITISRAARQADFPARFQLVAAMNPCPCGYLGHPAVRCRCSPDAVSRYQSRISGPLLDRIDLQLEVGAITQEELRNAGTGEASATIAARVATAHARQLARQGWANSELTASGIEQFCCTTPEAEKLLRDAMSRFAWSARAAHRVLKLARTIADLAQADMIAPAFVAEAIQYRRALRLRD